MCFQSSCAMMLQPLFHFRDFSQDFEKTWQLNFFLFKPVATAEASLRPHPHSQRRAEVRQTFWCTTANLMMLFAAVKVVVDLISRLRWVCEEEKRNKRQSSSNFEHIRRGRNSVGMRVGMNQMKWTNFQSYMQETLASV